MSSVRLIAAVVLSFSFLPNAVAEDVAAAKMHYERGTTLFDLQRYLEAAKEYEAAFEAKNDPALLFNIAQAYRFGGDYAKAIAAYRSFLRRVPEAENRADIERRIAELQKLADEQKRNQSTPPTGTLKPGENPPATPPPPTPETTTTSNAPALSPPPAVVEKPSKTKLIAGIVVGAVGIAAIAAGAAFEGLAASTNNSLSHPAMGTTFDPQKEQTLKSDEAAGAVLLAVGGAALVTGTVIAILGVRERRTHVAVIPAVSPTTVGAMIDARF
jgi:tetratricopeptide (TPR) repeat protein